MLHAVRNVCLQEPSIRVGQEVVDGVTLWDRTIVFDSVDVVVCCADAEFCFQQAGCNELQCWRNYQLHGASSDQQATLICPTSDLDNGVLERSFVKIGCDSRSVAVNTTRHERV